MKYIFFKEVFNFKPIENSFKNNDPIDFTKVRLRYQNLDINLGKEFQAINENVVYGIKLLKLIGIGAYGLVIV